MILTNAEVDWNSPTLEGVLEEDPQWLRGFSAAFQSATRIAMQDVPIDGFISGRSVRVHGDLDGGDPIIESPLIDSEATATPTLLSMLPFRQVGGQERVQVSIAHNSHDLSIVASHPDANSQRVNVIITNTARTITSAPITYDLQLTGMPAPTEGDITYKLAVLNQDSQGLDDFRFTEAGKTTPSAEAGWTLSHEIGLNETHYVEFTSP